MATTALSLLQVPEVKVRYSNVLRCIGQSLESMDLKALEVRTHGDDYIIQGWHKGTSISMDFEKHYTPDDIKRLETEGKKKRKPFPGPANLLSLSHILRMSGNYVDRALGRLVRVSWQDQSDKIQSVTIQYEPWPIERNESREGQIIILEEICIHLYKQRKKIASSPDKHFPRPFVSVGNSN